MNVPLCPSDFIGASSALLWPIGGNRSVNLWSLPPTLTKAETHAGAAISAMGGFVSDARQWRKYEKRAGKLLDRFGVKMFHAIDVRRGHGDFKGWTVDRKVKFWDEFQHIINETVQSGVVAFIRDDDYKYYSGLYWRERRDGIPNTPSCFAPALPRLLT